MFQDTPIDSKVASVGNEMSESSKIGTGKRMERTKKNLKNEILFSMSKKMCIFVH